MKHLFIYPICYIALLCVYSCIQDPNNESKEFLKETDPEFNTERQVIYFKEMRENDIQANIDYTLDMKNNKLSLGCSFTYYNYGGFIKLYEGSIDDYFMNDLGQLLGIVPLQQINNFRIDSRNTDEKYGDWALVSITEGLRTISNIFMTPLSLKAYDKGELENLYLFTFAINNKLLFVIFHGTNTETAIITQFPNSIISRTSRSGDVLKSGPGMFWKDPQDF